MPMRPSDASPPDAVACPTVPVPADPLIGATLGSYRVVRRLSQGGMGCVYLAEHPAIGSRVAIKVLLPRYAEDPEIVERFFNEARAVNLIGHENIVQILDFNTATGRSYFVMEYLAGETVHGLLKRAAPLSLERAGPIVLQCCRALAAAHAQGIVHRDLKPDNVFLIERAGRGDFVKLMDFGIAKLTDGGAVRTQEGSWLGTPPYMSPEQAAGTGSVDGRSDVYALGVMLFQMVTGRLPFGTPLDSAQTVLAAHLLAAPPRPRSIVPALPDDCEKIILKALAKQPQQRFQTMVEMHDALTACLLRNRLSVELPPAQPAGPAAWRSTPPPVPVPSSPERTPSVSTKSTRARKRFRVALASAGIAAVLAAIIGGAVVIRKQAGPSRPAGSETPIDRQDAPPILPHAETAPRKPAQQETPPSLPLRQPDRSRPASTKRPPIAKAKEAPPVELVQLKLASAPAAKFVAAWAGGSKAGSTPFAISVPRNAEVFVRFVLDGYQPAEARVTPSKDQVVFVELSAVR